MGDPGRLRKQFEGPRHPWQRERIYREKDIFKEFGLRNKKEIYKAQSVLRVFAAQAKRLTALRSTLNPQVKKEEEQLLTRLHKLGLLNAGASLEDVLSLTVRDVLNRRLQTLVFKKNLARTSLQARQFIIHNHIFINTHKMNVPSYLVLREEEHVITYNPSSSLAVEDHPERPQPKEVKIELKKEEKKEEKPKEEIKEKPKKEHVKRSKPTKKE
jgi:small subunit ribosomal protein S4